MLAEMKWLRMAYDAKMKSLDNYEDKQEFKAYAKRMAMKWHADMTAWQPEPKPAGDSIMDVMEIIEDAVTGELPEVLQDKSTEGDE